MFGGHIFAKPRFSVLIFLTYLTVGELHSTDTSPSQLIDAMLMMPVKSTHSGNSLVKDSVDRRLTADSPWPFDADYGSFYADDENVFVNEVMPEIPELNADIATESENTESQIFDSNIFKDQILYSRRNPKNYLDQEEYEHPQDVSSRVTPNGDIAFKLEAKKDSTDYFTNDWYSKNKRRVIDNDFNKMIDSLLLRPLQRDTTQPINCGSSCMRVRKRNYGAYRSLLDAATLYSGKKLSGSDKFHSWGG